MPDVTRVPAAGRLVVPLVLGLPVAAGLLATILPAFGFIPGLRGSGLSANAWSALADWPGISGSVALTLRTGLLATALSLATALALGLGRRRWTFAAAPLLAMPHAALAVGLGFLIAPTGFLVRLAGLDSLGVATVGDRFGAAVIAALWLKETPFLLLCVLAAMGQADVARARMISAGLGYAPLRTALLVVLPRLWPQLRLPVMAVLAFSLSVTDVAIVLGPQTPPTLAVRILRWSLDPDLARWTLAGAGSLLLTALVLAGFALLLLAERCAATLGRRLLRRGGRGRAAPDRAAAILAGLLSVFGGGALATLVLWAGAASWRFPAALPSGWSGANLAARVAGLAGPAATTLWLAVVATALALVLAGIALRAGAVSRVAWLPLLLPQAGFLFGVQILLVAARLDGTAAALVWGHLLFVLPYVLLALRGPFAALDPRYGRAAASLGASPARVLWRVTLPLLARPLLAAGAIGISVSVALYLPTLFAGAGRFDTLATEAVTLSAGSDRRILAAAALAQAALPLAAFAMAFAGRRAR